MLQAYVVSASVLAIAWPLDILGGNKNPVGQLIGSAILLLVGVRSLSRLLPCLVILVPGLLVTQSRGAIIATVIGTIVLIAMQGLSTPDVRDTRDPPRADRGGRVCAAAVGVARAHNHALSASTQTRAGYAIEYRQKYTADAWEVIHAHPWTGVGVGNYQAGRRVRPHAVDRPASGAPPPGRGGRLRLRRRVP